MKPFVRTILLWFLLVVVFLAFFNWFNTPREDVGSPELAHAVDRPSLLWEVLGSWLPVVLVAGGLFAFFVWRARRTNQRNTDGITLLQKGRFLDALKAFEAVRDRNQRAGVGWYNAGIALLGLWRVVDADASFATAAAKDMRLWDFRTLLAPQRALTAALLDRRTDVADRLVECASLAVADSAQATLAKAVLAAREGRWPDARAELQRYEVKMLSGPTRGLADALTAWAAEQLTGQLRHVDKVALFGETGPDGLKKVWPELVGFVDRAPAA